MNTNNTITIHTQLREPIVFPGYKPCITVGQLLRRLHGSDVSLADMKWEDGCGDGVGVFLWINSQYEFHGMVASWDGVELCISQLEEQMAAN